MFAFETPRPTLPASLAPESRVTTLARTRRIPLGPPWQTLLPEGGLRRGSSVVVRAEAGRGGVATAWSLVALASTRGQWVGVVGVEDAGALAMHELGVDLTRVLFVPRPRGAWAEAAADLLDGVDLLVVRPPSRATHVAARRLVARARERGVVLIVVSEPCSPWPLPPDVTIEVTSSTWRRGAYLDARELSVLVTLRGSATPQQTHRATLPDAFGYESAS